jgi:hypothetical protein
MNDRDFGKYYDLRHYLKMLRQYSPPKKFEWTNDSVIEFAMYNGRYSGDIVEAIGKFKTEHGDKPRLEPKPKYVLPSLNNDWEIVRYRDRRGGSFCYRFIEEEREFLDIYSVKRLSDGEVFSVGDNTTWGVIESFRFEDDKLVAVMEGEWSNGQQLRRYITHIQKRPTPSQPQNNKERITVRVMPFENYAEGKFLGYYVVEPTKPIPTEKLSEIQSAIEKILNNDK